MVLGIAPSRSSDRASEHLARARRLSLEFKHEEALAAVADAEALLERDALSRADVDALFFCQAMRALIESNLGRPERATAALRAAAVLRPDGALDAVTFPPDLREAFAAAASAARAARKSPVRVAAQPAGAEVRVDGDRIGASPVGFEAIPGRHYLRVEAVGYAPRIQAIDVPPEGRGTKVEVLLSPADAAAAASQVVHLDPSLLPSLMPASRSALTRGLEARTLVRYQDPKQPRADLLLALDLDTGGVKRVAAADLGSRRGDGSHERRDDNRSVVSSPWFWVAVGAVVAGGVVTAILVSQEPDPVLRIEPARR